jgi:hypothetical protein
VPLSFEYLFLSSPSQLYLVGGICVYNGINNTFWMHNRTLMAVTNGTIVNSMLAWLPEDNATNPLYETCM